MTEKPGTAFLVVVTSAVLALYAIEALISIAPSAWIDKLGTTLRKGPSVIAETFRMRERGIDAYPYLQPDTFVDSTRMALDVAGDSAVIPLSGIPNTLTILCNESGTTIGYRSDSLGFRNPHNVWEPVHPEVVVIGDSFAHGFCRTDSESIAGLLRAKGIRVANLGLTGAGPLAELGVIREYASAARPRDVFWLFYEGNDLIDLVSERKTQLARYLDPHFSQHVQVRSASIATLEKRFADSLVSHYKPVTMGNRVESFFKLRSLRTATGLYRGVEQPAMRNESREVALLRDVLARADSDVKAWGGRLHIVYLPERRRFDRRTRPVVGENHNPAQVEQAVVSIARELNIPVLNAAEAFAKEPRPAALWNARRYHYNARGYRIVAELIEQGIGQLRDSVAGSR